MKITFLAPKFTISGGTKIILMYAHHLAKLGHDVRVVAVSGVWWRRSLANLLQVKPRWFKALQAKVLRVKNYEEESLPPADVIVASSWVAARMLQELSPQKGKKFYLVQHDERLYHGDRKQVEETYRYTDFQKITVSTWLQDTMEKEFHSQVALLVNPFDHAQFTYIPGKRKEGEMRVLMLHHSYEWKGVAEGIALFQKVKKQYPHMRLILFGARKKEIDVDCDEYHYDIPQDKLKELYSSCDVYLCPSWDEGFGLPCVEAMACKCALVTYDNGGSRDFAFHEKTALVAKRKDVHDLARQLERMVRDNVLRNTLAEKGFQYVHAMPTWDEQTKKMEHVFKSSLQ